jgi:U32 family peptidase
MSESPPRSAPELLCPAGDWDALRAALEAGADAVYFGLSDGFNARARATNFSSAELPEVLSTIHRAARRGYLTLNTLVFDSEWDSLHTVIRRAADAGVDALIIQDLGVVRRVRQLVPSMSVHASTQMTCTDEDAMKFAGHLGIDRISLPRELTLEQLRTLRSRATLGLEVFVHGALCISYSGQCLLSQAFGGRSANRGLCAQPCRLPYELLVDGQPSRTRGAHLLSPKDLDASRLVGDLVAAGVDALKIEGRQKSAKYVMAATLLYRRAIDAAVSATEVSLDSERQWVHEVFSRGEHTGHLGGISHPALVDPRTSEHVGLLLGTYRSTLYEGGKSWLVLSTSLRLSLGDGIVVGPTATGHEVGGRVWGLLLDGQPAAASGPAERLLVWLGPEVVAAGLLAGTEVRRTSSPEAARDLEHAVAKGRPREEVVARITGRLGQRPTVEFRTARGKTATAVVDSVLEKAVTRGLSAELAADKLGRLGETPYHLLRVELELEPDTTVATSALNRARRELVEQLLEGHRVVHACAEDVSDSTPPVPMRPHVACGAELHVLCRTEEQARVALGAGVEGVYLDLPRFSLTQQAFERLRAEGYASLGLATPRLQKPGEVPWEPRGLALEPAAILVRSLGSMARLVGLRGAGTTSHFPRLVGDVCLNVANAVSARVLLAAGLDVITPSVEVEESELDGWFRGGLGDALERVLYSSLPVLHTEYCLYAAHLSLARNCEGCPRPCRDHRLSLRDRTGHELSVVAEGSGRSTVYLGTPRWTKSRPASAGSHGFRRFRLELLEEGGAKTDELVAMARGSIPAAQAP